jgi:RNA polymerase sigma-70 factor (ECF subfamily)
MPEVIGQKGIVDQIINSLPDQQRIIIQLREIEGYEFAQIAEILGLSESTVRVNLSRARKTIKEELVKINGYGL